MRSIAIRKTWFSAVLALIFMGVFSAQPVYASAFPVGSSGAGAVQPWNSVDWLTNQATKFTNAGVTWLGTKMDESVQTTADYVGWGTGAGTTAVTDTTLFTEDSGGSPAYARVVATRTVITTTVTGDTIQWVASLTANATKTITNAGNFTASSGGSPIVKGDFTGIVLATNDIIQITITLQITTS